MRKADLYVIEGPDAVGKATQAKLLAEYLDCPKIAFPRYDTPHGKLIEGMLHREVFCGMANPAAHDLPQVRMLQAFMTWDRYTCAELWDATTLVLDRYWHSGWVYGGLDGLASHELVQAHRGLPVAKHAFLLDVPTDEQMRRLVARGRKPDKYEEKQAFLEQVRARYLELFSEDPFEGDPALSSSTWALPANDWHVIDGTGSPEAVHERIIQAMVHPEREN